MAAFIKDFPKILGCGYVNTMQEKPGVQNISAHGNLFK
jgi:hypothetical protein